MAAGSGVERQPLLGWKSRFTHPYGLPDAGCSGVAGADGLGEADGLGVGEADGLGETRPVGEADGLGVGEADGLGVGSAVLTGSTVTGAVVPVDTDGAVATGWEGAVTGGRVSEAGRAVVVLPAVESSVSADEDAEGPGRGVPVPSADGVTSGLAVGVAEGDPGVAVGVGEALGEPDGEAEGLALGDAVAVATGVDGLAVPGVAVAEADGVGEGVGSTDAVARASGVGVAVGVVVGRPSADTSKRWGTGAAGRPGTAGEATPYEPGPTPCWSASGPATAWTLGRSNAAPRLPSGR